MAEARPDPQYVIPIETEVVLLDCAEAFNGLTSQEKLYAHHLAQAGFKGGLIVLLQTSPEAPGIFVLLQKLFRAQNPAQISELAKSLGFTEEEIKAFLIYAAAFYGNMGNYKSFGDTKFVPDVAKEKVSALIQASAAYQSDPERIQRLWDHVNDRMFSLEGRQKELGLGQNGISTYYSGNCDENDAKLAQEFMDAKGISPYNTRLFKTQAGDGQVVYEVRLASTETNVAAVPGYEDEILRQHDFTPRGSQISYQFNVTRGDYSPLMAMVCEELEAAQRYASNESERQMLAQYIASFTTGSISAHKDGSRFWIANTGPVVETYIGFIESYRDPHGVRGEFEGFVAVVNKKMSAKFAALVDNAEHLLAHLPWPREFEKDTFHRPDFTSLDVLGFGGSGIPAGINIPNYDDIRQSEGFKNVSLGNVLASGYKDTKVTFVREEDKELFTNHKIASFEVQVGLHELLGHGSGKLFNQKPDGSFDFPKDNITHPETQGPITSFYKPGETWDSVFTTLSSTYEECRAECVGIYLCLLADALSIFGHEGEDADDIIFVNWLNMVRAGLMALEFYSPETRQWRQAHMNARFVILQVLLEAGQGLVSIEEFTGEDGEPDLRVVLNRSLIIPVGQPAIGNFLRKLQVYKATADLSAAKEMYAKYSDVNNQGHPQFLRLRSIVLARKQPRKLFVQHHSYVEDNEVKLRSYESTASDLIQSNIDRFPPEIDQDILNLWENDRQHF